MFVPVYHTTQCHIPEGRNLDGLRVFENMILRRIFKQERGHNRKMEESAY
jgi:hypothetical protein